jgi:hypothetical protein
VSINGLLGGIDLDFKKIGVNAAESNTGFVVRRKSRFELEYIENGETVNIEVEPGDGLAIYVSSLKRSGSEQIIKNICAAMDFLGTKYVLS